MFASIKIGMKCVFVMIMCLYVCSELCDLCLYVSEIMCTCMCNVNRNYDPQFKALKM